MEHDQDARAREWETKRALWDAHRLVTLNLSPSVRDEMQFDTWIAAGITVAHIEAALDALGAWNPPPEHPWSAFRNEVRKAMQLGGRAPVDQLPESLADPVEDAIWERVKAGQWPQFEPDAIVERAKIEAELRAAGTIT